MADADAVRRDLAPRVRGDLMFDLPHRALYRTAACLFERMPLGVVAPADEASLAALLAYARARSIPLTARGAGTGVAGQTVGSGIIVDFSRYMNRVVEIDPGRRRVRVQPGAPLSSINEALAPHGLTVGVDPSSGAVCTIGGMAANNAAGIHTPAYGATRDVVRSVRWLADDAGRMPDIERDLRAMWPSLRDAAATDRPQALKNSSGYHLYDAEPDVARLLVGSEGTLGMITELDLEVFPLPAQRTLVRVGFEALEAAAGAVAELRALRPAALEMLDRTVTDLVPDLVPQGARYVLLAEFFDDAAGRTRSTRGAVSWDAAGESERPKLWNARKAISPLLERLPGPERSTRVIEDIAVDPSRLAEFVKGLHALLERHATRGVVFGHAADGHLHVNLLTDPKAPDGPERLERIAADAVELTRRLRGTLSGEHGDGILRAPHLRAMFPHLYPHFERVKRVFDPANILNPGKKVAPADARFADALRGARRPGRPREAFDRCNGCGHCLSYCPAYAAEPRIENLPRAISDARAAAADGGASMAGITAGVEAQCPSCNKCVDHCPAGFDPLTLAAGGGSSAERP